MSFTDSMEIVFANIIHDCTMSTTEITTYLFAVLVT